MATANVIDHDQERDQKRQDDISSNYEKLLAEVRELQEAAEYWRATMSDPHMQAWLAKREAERATERESWDFIKPAQFPESRSLVRAIVQVTRKLTDMPGDLMSEYRAKKQTLFNYWQMNEIILLGAGYKFDVEAAKREGLDKPAVDEAEASAPGEATDSAPVIVITLNQEPPKKFAKSLESRGFENNGIGEYRGKKCWLYVGADTKENRDWCEIIRPMGEVVDIQIADVDAEGEAEGEGDEEAQPAAGADVEEPGATAE